jgi:hypothetical protein
MMNDASGGTVVDQSMLETLAFDGIAGVGGNMLASLADWCWDWCEATGNGAYASISVTLRRIDRWWSEYSAIPTVILESLDDLLRRDLPHILAAEDPSSAAQMARSLRLEAEALLLPPEQWPTRSLAAP